MASVTVDVTRETAAVSYNEDTSLSFEETVPCSRVEDGGVSATHLEEAVAAEGTGDRQLDVMVDDRNHSVKKQAVRELISSTFAGDTKEAIIIFEEIKEDYDEERKKGKKGPLYNRKGSNKYAFVITVDELYKMFLDSVRSFWHAADLKPSDDIQSWKNDLTDNERHFIKNTLAFFETADGIVNENIIKNFMGETDRIEVAAFYSFQLAIESIHNQVYGLFLKTYIDDEKERDRLLNAIENIEVVKKKARWAKRWIDDGKASYGERLVAFACVEGIFFSSSFASIFWLKNRKGKKLLPQLVASNELISRDEGMHMMFAVKMLKYLHAEDRPSVERIHEIVEGAVVLELEFVSDSLRVDLVQGMTVEKMKQYIMHTADYLLNQFEVPKIYNVDNPFNFMHAMNFDNETNSFGNTVTEYKKIGGTESFVEYGSDDYVDF
nr:MAG: ribonucleotide reductase small subunit [Hemigrapsus takanoi nimavirus]